MDDSSSGIQVKKQEEVEKGANTPQPEPEVEQLESQKTEEVKLGEKPGHEDPKMLLHLYQHKLVQYIDLDSLWPYLIQQELLSHTEIEILVDATAPQNVRVLKLLHFIEGKGGRGFQLFVKALSEEQDHLGHRKLADIFAPYRQPVEKNTSVDPKRTEITVEEPPAAPHKADKPTVQKQDQPLRRSKKNQYENVDLRGNDHVPKRPPKTYLGSKTNPPEMMDTNSPNNTVPGGADGNIPSQDQKKVMNQEVEKGAKTPQLEPEVEQLEPKKTEEIKLGEKPGHEEVEKGTKTPQLVPEVEQLEPKKTEEVKLSEMPSHDDHVPRRSPKTYQKRSMTNPPEMMDTKKKGMRDPRRTKSTKTAKRLSPPPTDKVLPYHAAYHGSINGEEAEKILLKYPDKNCYLLRYSENCKCYTLTIRNSDKISNIDLDIGSTYFCLVKTDKEFNTLESLLDYYVKHPLNEIIRTIGLPCKSSAHEPLESSEAADGTRMLQQKQLEQQQKEPQFQSEKQQEPETLKSPDQELKKTAAASEISEVATMKAVMASQSTRRAATRTTSAPPNIPPRAKTQTRAKEPPEESFCLLL